jgi:hypothetical protein
MKPHPVRMGLSSPSIGADSANEKLAEAQGKEVIHDVRYP